MAIRYTTHDHILHQIHYRLRVLSIHELPFRDQSQKKSIDISLRVNVRHTECDFYT